LSKSTDLHYNPKQSKFVFIGRYERRKGVEELTELIKNMNYFSAAEFHFIGPIPDEKRLQKENVFYHGLVKETDKIKSILEKSDVLICPSHSEGMPTVILEAMACHCAIIATDVGAVSLQVDNNNGWLIPPKDKAALEKAINEAIDISDEELILKKLTSQKRIDESFLWDHVCTEHMTFFEQINQKA
jgi:glycosyltransferase involved in cell wall biosynthesis